MRHLLFAIAVMFAVLPAVDVVAQSGPPVENPDPGDGGGGGALGCYDCSYGSDGMYASCSLDDGGGRWVDCEGGQICWRSADGEEVCQPYCGENRCYLA